ncbi:hypothetical protein FRACYDRAFT_233521 [Fragilariopsis cylindrus CCMP1102]|uniref:Sulfotransferase domain-containing protein n=1 Tax=Fragilariopsis cylindrus CCMP1102 TaxID=635003 RepID=A0A1E7FYX2_9STRA|nr:hypothetical protein FRACYDRAFT_233521 [Fragilariopsis cylindrus CCMP1102]|eukprot:OEU23349.1 hypothetical protein FRACYDRAFT_233521 [Fragilariopsis cylindrus CCMP1102]
MTMVKINKDENNRTNNSNNNDDDDNVAAIIRRRRPPYIISYSVLTVLCFCIGSLFSSYNSTTNISYATIKLYYLINSNFYYDVKIESSSSSNSIINTTTAATATTATATATATSTFNHTFSSASASPSSPEHNDGGSSNNEDITSSSQLPVATNASLLSSSSLQLLLSVDSDSEEDSELDLIEYISPDPNEDIDPLSLYVDLDKALRNEDDPRRYVRVLKKPLDPTFSLSNKLTNTPIFVMTLPKGGTTTIHNYFQCGYGLQNNTYSIHHLYPSIRNNKRIANRIGTTMKNNLDQNKPILSPIIYSKTRKTNNNTTNSDDNDLSQYSVFSDFGSFDFVKKNRLNSNNKRNKESSPRTTLLQTDILDNIIRYYPNSTLLYIRRSPDDWYNSAKNWDGGQLLQKLRLFKSSKLTNSFFPSNIDRYSKFSSSVSSDDGNNGHSDSYPYYNNNPEQDKHIFTTFYKNYESYLRKFVIDHNNDNAQNNNAQNLTYIELPLNNETGIEMEKLTGISSKLCWSKSNIGHYIAT